MNTLLDPGLLTVIAIAAIVVTLVVSAAAALAHTVAAAAGHLCRRTTRTRQKASTVPAAQELPEPTSEQDRAALAAALGCTRTADVIAHTLHTHGRTLAHVRTMTDQQLLAIPGIGDTSLATIRRHLGPPTANPLDVMAAALDDWWLLTDPHAEFNGADIAPRIQTYLHDSGYHITRT